MSLCLKPSIRWKFLSSALVMNMAAWCANAARAAEFQLQANAGPHLRIDAVVTKTLAIQDLGLKSDAPELAGLEPGKPVAWLINRADSPGKAAVVEAERQANSESVRLTWVEAGEWPAGQNRRWVVKSQTPADFQTPWLWKTAEDGQIELHHARKGLVFRYNQKPNNQPGLPPTQLRGAYIHPFLTPSGKLTTGDFSPSHTHHRGFFLAYAKTKLGDLTPDFWNIHGGTAKIEPVPASIKPVAGPVVARLSLSHAWQLRDKTKPGKHSGESVLTETWNLAVYEISGQPAWVWDLESTQTPGSKSIELVKHRYGGMAYRGPEPFVKGKLDVLTSEGNDDRKKADQKPARWIDLTGPVAEGSADYAGAVMCDHPSNVRFPNVVRIHPVTLPFFSFVPAYNENLKLESGRAYTWRYRTMVHDGHPNKTRDEALFADFAHPATVEIAPARP